MADKRIVLEVAAFLDSSQGSSLAGVAESDVRGLAEALVAGSYDDLGREPWELDGQALEVLLGRCLPARMGAQDPRARHVGAVTLAWLAYLEESHVVSQSFELRQAFDGALASFQAAVASGELAGTRAAAPADPFVHGAPKLGRNDPCSCGSGKKFKKCHGKNA